jgi:hypothetical protein
MTRKCGSLAITNHFQAQLWRELEVIRTLRLIRLRNLPIVAKRIKKINVAVI